MKILAIIPARGGSKGIPRKNIRLMAGKPLIAYAINNGLKSKYITDLIVSTDDYEIKKISNMYGARVIDRPADLANDKATLDPVIFHATKFMEEEKEEKYDAVVTLQPTSPLLCVDTLDKALEKFINNDYDCIISAINAPHLSWKVIDNEFVPNYNERLNRQLLPANYLETGAFFISRRNIVTENSRIGGKISLFEVPLEESMDIDNVNDWIVCESQLKRKNIVLRCDGNKKIGMGHIYHCITLAHNFIEHNITIVTNKNDKEGYNKLLESNLNVVSIESDDEFIEYLSKNKTDIVVNDCLDTSEEYINNLKKYVERVVTIEDMGPGSKIADAVINALYQNKDSNEKNVFFGPKYVCLRDEFLLNNEKIINENVQNVLVIFGGTDPSNLTEKVYNVCKMEKYQKINFNIVMGLGTNIELNNVNENIKIYHDVKNMCDFMRDADIAFTSQGRTIYELASCGVPSIVMAQNKRELLHTFGYMENGFLNLGLGVDINEITIEHTLDWLINTPNIRKQMNSLMLKHDLTSGVKNEIKIILGENI